MAHVIHAEVCALRSDDTEADSRLLRSIRPKRATPRSLSPANAVDGGIARAVPELPSPRATAGSAEHIAAEPPLGHQNG
jgi:hypothetical protein